MSAPSLDRFTREHLGKPLLDCDSADLARAIELMEARAEAKEAGSLVEIRPESA